MSVNFYNENAKSFFENTVNANMEETYKIFLQFLSKGDHILDLGCGSGRDSKNFLDRGYFVTSLDLSEDLGKLAEEYIGQQVLIGDMRNLNFENKFQGIWACASLLHLSENDLDLTLDKIHKALTTNGILYCSFKYGNLSYIKDGRQFTCFTEETFKKLISNKKFIAENIWITSDVRKERAEEKWLNVILKKS